MPRIRTASRLHFGLLSLPGEETPWPNPGEALLARRYGSVGLMIESPGLAIRAEPSSCWKAEGPLADRALAVALAFQRRFDNPAQAESTPQRLIVESAPREHVGLGTGTQLALAVARLLAHAWGANFSVEELAHRVERGARSGLGVHGFARGGFLVDGGKGHSKLAPLVARLEFPEAWRVVLILPRQSVGLHGSSEQAAFTKLSAGVATTDALCRLVLLGMLPALVEEDLQAFGEALFDFNAKVGEMFKPLQGSIYSSPAVAEWIGFLRRQGVAGVGQSSWGPGVFAVVASERAADLAERLRAFLPNEAQTIVSRGCNRGANLEE